MSRSGANKRDYGKATGHGLQALGAGMSAFAGGVLLAESLLGAAAVSGPVTAIIGAVGAAFILGGSFVVMLLSKNIYEDFARTCFLRREEDIEPIEVDWIKGRTASSTRLPCPSKGPRNDNSLDCGADPSPPAALQLLETLPVCLRRCALPAGRLDPTPDRLPVSRALRRQAVSTSAVARQLQRDRCYVTRPLCHADRASNGRTTKIPTKERRRLHSLRNDGRGIRRVPREAGIDRVGRLQLYRDYERVGARFINSKHCGRATLIFAVKSSRRSALSRAVKQQGCRRSVSDGPRVAERYVRAIDVNR